MIGKNEPKSSKIRTMYTAMYDQKMEAREERYKRFIDRSGPVVDLRMKYGNAEELVDLTPIMIVEESRRYASGYYNL